MEVTVQSQAELPHAQVEEDAQGKHDGSHYVHPLALEWSRVGLHGDDGIVVQFGKHHFVARVRQVVDDSFHLLADTFYLVVRLIAEEHLHRIGHTHETMLMGIGGDLFGDAVELNGIFPILGFADDNLLSEDVTLLAEPEQSHEERAIGIEIEHHRVVIGLVGDEDGKWSEHGRSQSLAKPNGPHASPRHSVACVIQYIVDDEHKHRDNDGDAKATFSDDGAQRCTYEEEDETRQGQRELVDSFNIVLTNNTVGILRDHGLELQFAHL